MRHSWLTQLRAFCLNQPEVRPPFRLFTVKAQTSFVDGSILPPSKYYSYLLQVHRATIIKESVGIMIQIERRIRLMRELLKLFKWEASDVIKHSVHP